MPTPFSHLRITHRLLHDDDLTDTVHEVITADVPAFLLGGVVADQKPHPDADRIETHFYSYMKPMPDNPWRQMFREYPQLNTFKSDSHRAFMASYVAHLAVDEYWSRYMLKIHIAEADWGKDIRWRFFVLHLLLIYMDVRDEEALLDTIPYQLRACTPNVWLPFLPDDKIIEWRDFIGEQLEGESQTFEIFASRVGKSVAEMREIFHDEDWMQEHLWQNVTPALLARTEREMYIFARQQMSLYLHEFGIIK